MKKKKSKPKYSVFQNVMYICKKAWKWNKKLIIFSVIRIPIIVLIPYLGIFLSSFVVKMVTRRYDPLSIVINTAIILCGIMLLNIANNILSGKIQTLSFNNRMMFIKLMTAKNMETDYANIESSAGQKKLTKAHESINSNYSATEAIINNCINAAADLFGIVSYAAVIVTLNPVIILVIAATSVLSYFVIKRRNMWEVKNRDNFTPIDRKLDYLWDISRDYTPAKDIRLYNMGGLFSQLFKKIFRERIFWIRKSEKQGFAADAVCGALTFIRDLISYGYLVFLLFANGLPVDTFVYYFGVIGGFSAWISGFIKEWGTLDDFSLRICELREYLEMPDKINHGKGVPVPAAPCDIEFKNVSFAYPESKGDTIKNINLHIKKGEKLAIVGMNGAGKTTLIKLLCGFYAPTGGEILVGGKNIDEYNIDEYYSLFCAVFQDINFLPISVAGNISIGSKGRESAENVNKVMELSGIKGKIDSLKKGAQSMMGKSIFDDAVDFSGGEKQKLALARALYKGGNILILDEPTAALDPIAENEMYMRYNEMTSGKTSVFISHRLASTRFCDRIILLEGGRITEEGSHDELMRRGGRYADIFEIQSHYYKKGAAQDAKEAVL